MIKDYSFDKCVQDCEVMLMEETTEDGYLQGNLPFMECAELEVPLTSVEDSIEDFVASAEQATGLNEKSSVREILRLPYKKQGSTRWLGVYESETALDDSELKCFGERHLGQRTLKAYSFSEVFGRTGEDNLIDFSVKKNLYLVFTTPGNEAYECKDEPLEDCLSRIGVKDIDLRETVRSHRRLNLRTYLDMLEKEKERKRRITFGLHIMNAYKTAEHLMLKLEGKSYQIPTSLRKASEEDSCLEMEEHLEVT